MLGLCVCAVVKIEPATQDQHSNRIALAYDDVKMLPAVRVVYHTDETIACTGWCFALAHNLSRSENTRNALIAAKASQIAASSSDFQWRLITDHST